MRAKLCDSFTANLDLRVSTAQRILAISRYWSEYGDHDKHMSRIMASYFKEVTTGTGVRND